MKKILSVLAIMLATWFEVWNKRSGRLSVFNDSTGNDKSVRSRNLE